MRKPNEYPVLRLGDLPHGTLRAIEVAGRSLVLARVDDAVYAVDAVCPHYGGPLAEGTLCGTRLRCPWHQACFDVTDGRRLEPPAREGLRSHPTRIEGDQVFVALGDEPAPRRSVTSDARRFVIVGSGAAGACAAQALREANFGGHVLLIDAEADGPYDRPALTKNYLAGVPLDHPLAALPAERYAQLNVERLQGRATAVDLARRAVQVERVGRVAYDALLVAPGATPRHLGVPGEGLPGVHALRSLRDCDAILAAANGADRVVVIGSGFIGTEAAASLRQRGLEVILVSPERVLLAAKLGEAIGRMYQQFHLLRGVKLRLESKVARFTGDVALRGVTLVDGTEIETTLAIVAVGVRPATDFLRGTLPLNDDGSVTVDRSLRAAETLFVAGDAARFPSPQTGELIRVEHWRTAEQLGRVAAFNMAGTATTFDDVPFFWTYQFEVGLDYVGHAEKWDDIVMDGDPETQSFLAYYLRGNAIAAVSGCNRSAETCAIAELMRAKRMPPADVVRAGEVDWLGLMNSRA